MKKSELRTYIKEELQRLFEIKYTQTNNLRIWLSPDKKTIYLDNVSPASTPQPIWPLIKAFQKNFGNLMVVNGDNKWIKGDDLVVIVNLDDTPINEKKLEKVFKKVSV